MKIWKIWKIAQSMRQYSSWILPNGDVAEVPHQRHYDYLISNHLAFNLSEKEMMQITTHFGMMDMAFKKGAVRLSTDYSSMLIEGHKKDVINFTEKIHRICKMLGYRNIICDFSGGGADGFNVKMSIEDLYNI